jgi:hypothetical protein
VTLPAASSGAGGGPPADPGVTDAVRQVVRSFGWLRWNRRRVVLVRRGEDRFWHALVAALSAEGVSVDDLRLPADDRRLRYRMDSPPLCEVPLAAGDLLVHHDPFLADGGETVCDDVRLLTGAGVGCVSLEFPCGRYAIDRVRASYLRALAAPVDSIRATSEAVRSALAGAVGLVVHSGSSILTVNRPGALLDDHAAPRAGAQILQLPLGESWFLPESGGVNGQVSAVGVGGSVREFAVDRGRIVGQDWAHGPLVEIGVGVNRRADPLPTALAEKAFGRVHLGFGDSALLGGEITHPRHADLYLVAGTRVRLQRADGSVRELADVLG